MTTRPVRSIIDDQLDDLVMPAGAERGVAGPADPVRGLRPVAA